MFDLKHWKFWSGFLLFVGIATFIEMKLLPEKLIYDFHGYFSVFGIILVFYALGCLTISFIIWLWNVDPKCVRTGKVSVGRYLSSFFASLFFVLTVELIWFIHTADYSALIQSKQSIIQGTLVFSIVSCVILAIIRLINCKKVLKKLLFKNQVILTA